MKTLPFFKSYAVLKAVPVVAMAVVLVSQSPVQAQSTAIQSQEMRNLVSKLNKEIDTRIQSTDKATKALESSNAVSSSAKNTVSSALNSTKKELTDIKKETGEVKNLTDAKGLASKLDSQYSKYATSTVSAMTLKDSDGQQQVFEQLQSLTGDAQSKIDEAGAGGQDVGNLQEALKGIKQLVESIGAILASIVALILALATGNFTEAATIFQAIIGQLAQNLVSSETAQNGLAGIIDGIVQLDFDFNFSAGPAGGSN